MDDKKFRYLEKIPPARIKNAPKKKISQAERVIEKFGGARRLSKILAAIGCPRDPSVIYRWTYEKSRGGTGGVVPYSVIRDLLVAARYEGVILTTQDLDPREMDVLDWVGRR